MDRPEHRAIRRLLGSVVTALILAASTASPALAHTELTSSSPANGDTVGRDVINIILTFSRPVRLLDESVRIVGADNGIRTVRQSDDGTVVRANLHPDLPDDTYEVAWRILAEDSHPRQGTFTFTLRTDSGPSQRADATQPPTRSPSDSATGAPATTEAPGPSESPDTVGMPGMEPGPVEPSMAPGHDMAPAPNTDKPLRGVFRTMSAIFRILMYLGMMSAMGLAIFTAWPHQGSRNGAPELAGWTARLGMAALVASLGEMATRVAVASNTSLAGFLDVDAWSSMFATGLGMALVLRTAGLTAMIYGGDRRRRLLLPSGPDEYLLSGAVAVIASFQFVGHTASASPEIVVRLSDFIHSLAAATWVGGIVGLTLLARHGSRRGRARATARFSTAATLAVVGVAISGVGLSLVNLPTIASIWETLYGQLLIAKLFLVGILAAIGGYNHLRVVPAIGFDDEDALALLRRTVTAELVLVTCVVALTALLVNQTPM